MASTQEISHKGRVVEITPDFTTVEIISESACSACHAKALCGLSESQSKAVQVPTKIGDDLSVGEEVNVVLSASMGHKAVWLAYVLPLCVMVAVLLCLVGAGAGELASGLSALGAVAVYYLVLWLLRGRLRNEYVFNIKR